MSWVDIAIIIVLFIPIFFGFRRGFLGSVAPLAGILVGVILAGRLYGSMANLLSNWIQNSTHANILGYVIILALAVLAAVSIAALMRRFLDLVFLGWIDRTGGLLFGGVVGAISAGAVLTLLMKFLPDTVGNAVSGSVLAAFFIDKFPIVLYLLPEQFNSVRQFFG
ncbi:MAG: CvpA family protein [Dehalococcoidia bacterium]|nr:CvpA family protein [Dehalococcoidia bacterium]